MPQLIDLSKFLHVICGTTLMGLSIASYYYLARADEEKNPQHYTFALGYSRIIICCCLAIACVPPLSGWLLVAKAPTLNWSIGWIKVAMALGISTLALLTLQLYLLSSIKDKAYGIQKKPSLHHTQLWRWSHYLLWLAIVLIIRDAVTQSTWF